MAVVIIIVPGWVMALPIIIGGSLGMWLIQRRAKTNGYRTLLMLGLIMGVVGYYLVIRQFEVHPGDDKPPAPVDVPYGAVAV